MDQSIRNSMNTTTKTPLWRGPQEDGITFSMLSKFLTCRERFRLYVIEGLRTEEVFNHRIEFGNMWHVCEEYVKKSNSNWETALKLYCSNLCRAYRTQQTQINHWYNVCKIQFPIYLEYWKWSEMSKVIPLLQEKVFSVEYELPSGRSVLLRGKWDSVDLVGNTTSTKGVYIQENKTKGDINEFQIKNQLTFDLQTMLYMIAYKSWVIQDFDNKKEISKLLNYQLHGVRYNVIRRPLSGGKGTIVKHKPSKKNPIGESESEFYNRLSGIIRKEPQEYFMRWTIQITNSDIRNFKQRCLNPVLESLCDWWEVARHGTVEELYASGLHWQHPYGIRNIINEGGSSDLDEYLHTGSTLGLVRVNNLFRELEE